MHVPPLGPVHPALHVQVVEAVLRAGELEFVGQLLQSDAASLPAEARYLPDAHDIHGLLTAPVVVEYVPACVPHVCIHVHTLYM